MELNKLFEGITERYKNLVLFMPIYDLKQLTKYPYDLMEIGFSVLLFIIDKMLTEKGYVTNDQLHQFLLQLMKEVYKEELSYEEISELRAYLVDEKLRNNGKDFFYEYTDYGKETKNRIQFSLIETHNFKYSDHLDNKVKLKLTEKGIELLFKTKEMFSEMQISITMLYFKQQLDKLLYGPALNTVKDLIFQIDTQIRSIEDFAEKIRRNTMSVFNRKEIEERYEKSYKQTLEEKEQLKGLQEYVSNVVSNYISGNLTSKEKKKYATILEIENYLNRSITKHEILFAKKMDLLKSLTDSIQLLIENAFSRNFHFEQEILQAWIEKLITEEKIHSILKPLIPIKKTKYYHPFWAFVPQVTRKMTERSQAEIDEMDEEAKEKQLQEEERQKELNFHSELKMLKIILEPLVYKESYLLSDLLKDLRKSDFQLYQEVGSTYLQHFLNMSIQMHSWQHKNFETEEDPSKLTFLKDETKLLIMLTNEVKELEEIKEFEMYATDKEYEFEDGVKMTDYYIRRKVEVDAI
jgi:hypothetical protein